MAVKLTGVPGSHPTLAAQLMLEYKGIAYRRRDLPNQLQRILLPKLGYPSDTVPALRLEDGTRLSETIAIVRALDELQPEPPLLPADPEARRAVEEAEAWADDALQDCARQLGQWAAKRDRDSLWAIARDSYLPFPTILLKWILPVIAPIVLARFRVSDEAARERLATLAAHLDRVDAWIGSGLLGGEQPNAADFQVATSIRLLLLFDDLRPLIEQRPAGRLALRLAPNYPGRFRSVFPAAWLAPLVDAGATP